jgi:enamine deaminase RidA (YjgF/YER057c/UK114 family)
MQSEKVFTRDDHKISRVPQCVLCFDNIKAILTAAGMTFADVIVMRPGGA